MAQSLSHPSVTDPIPRDWGERAIERDDFGQTHRLTETSKVCGKHSSSLIKINILPPKKSHFKAKAYWIKRTEEEE